MYDTVAFLLLASVMLGGMVIVAAEEVRAGKVFFQSSALDASLDSLFYTAEVLPVGSQERVEINIPEGVSSYAFEPAGDGWIFVFVFNEKEIRRPVGVRLVFAPSDLLDRPGAHSVIVEKESGDSAVIKQY